MGGGISAALPPDFDQLSADEKEVWKSRYDDLTSKGLPHEEAITDLQKIYGIPAAPPPLICCEEACAVHNVTETVCSHTYLRKTAAGYYCLDCRETISMSRRLNKHDYPDSVSQKFRTY
jgi:hypothetical protein